MNDKIAIDEFCTRCKGILPAYGHDAICDSCDKMLTIYRQNEVIAELLGALKHIIENCRVFCEDSMDIDDGAVYAARAAITKEEQRIK